MTKRPSPYRLTPSQMKKGKRLYKAAKRFDHWLRRVGVTDPAMRSRLAVDLADSTMAMEDFLKSAAAVVRFNPATKRGARRALRHAANIGVLASTELTWHIRRLNRYWERHVENRLGRISDGR